MSEALTESAVPPRTFISYSWSSPTHESWVVALAERLVQDGIDVILDKWDLKPGHDANLFMEQMVGDAGVTKVLMICDRIYVEKANSRTGGVGTESQIISPQLYENNSSRQNKFAAVCIEVDDHGNPYVPVFYKGRVYFDFASSERQEIAYEELLRWLADKPRYLKPKIGTLPASINNPDLPATSTASRARRAEDAIRNGLASAQGALQDYLDGLLAELPNFRLQPQESEPHDETVLAAVQAMRPYAAEFQMVIGTLIRYQPLADIFEIVLDAIEGVGAFMFRPEDARAWGINDFDAYIVFAHDLFLGTFARALKSQHFDLAARQVNRRYVIRTAERSGERASHSFEIFCGYPESLERRNSRLKLNRSSFHADLINGWHTSDELGFPAILQADFVLWLISRLRNDQSNFARWYPYTITYTAWTRPYEIFARAESQQYFDRISPMLGHVTAGDLQKNLATIDQSDNALQAGYRRFSAAALANATNLGVLP